MGNTLMNLFNNKAPSIPTNLPYGSSMLDIQSPPLDNETLPYGGGTYNPAGASTIKQTPPAPIFNAPQAPATPAAPENNFRDKYRDPKTGDVMSPDEYALYLGNKIPKGNGDVTNYAGDAMTNPNQTAGELNTRATDLNNSRNDIATGTTDPFKAGNKSGIAYSPQELKAIESAYAGIYDPALNDVFARLQEKKSEEAKKAAREERVFATNESIRQWQATTGTRPTSGSTVKSKFTDTQINKGATASGLGLEAFEAIEDDDIKNFFINPPSVKNDQDKTVPMYKNFEEDMAAIEAGERSVDDVTDDILSSPIPQSVKTYFIEHLPIEPEKKQGIMSKIWEFAKPILLN